MIAKRKLYALVLLAGFALMQGCGGGGGASTGAAPVPEPVAPAPAAASVPNVQTITVGSGLSNNVNLLTTSVRLCAPGSSTNCQTIDHVVIDTGSVGLRILSSALAPSLAQALPQQTDAYGTPVLECAHFVDGYTWGPVRLADLQLSGEHASSLPIQVIGDADFATAPDACAGVGPSKNSVTELRANGILGLSVFRQDCGSACTLPNNRAMYYTCASPVCQQTPLALERQVQNPVTLFAVNNNGVIIKLPSVPSSGAASLSGTLVFGIGTQANNALGAATVLGLDPVSGNFTTLYNGGRYSASFIDSGSNGLFFADNITLCAIGTAAPGFYCPASTLGRVATLQGANGASATVNFSIANAAALLSGSPGFVAFANLGAPFAGHGFDWGLPFFFGRNVYTAIDGASTPGGLGPYVAF